LKDMKTFNLQIILIAFLMGVGELWGQTTCGATGIQLIKLDNSASVATVTLPSLTVTADVCKGELNRYRLVISGITSDQTVTYTYNSTIIIQSGTSCTSGVGCNQSAFEFYLSPSITSNEPIQAVVTGPSCSSSTFILTLNPGLVMPSFSIQNSNATHSSAVVGTAGSKTSNSIACENSSVNLTATCSAPMPNFCDSYVWSSGTTTSPYVTTLGTSNHVVTLTASSSVGCKVQEVHTVNVKLKPTLSAITVSNVCVGNPATSSVTATNFSSITGATVSYSWSISGPSSQSVTNNANLSTNSWTTSNIITAGTTYLMSVSATAVYTQSSNNISCISSA
jgi:hypothetical protein